MGSGNEEICRKTMDYLMEYIDSGKDSKDLDVVIGWSLVSRWEYYDNGWKGLTPNSVSDSKIDTITTDYFNLQKKIC